MQPGTSRQLDDRADGFPGPLSKLPRRHVPHPSDARPGLLLDAPCVRRGKPLQRRQAGAPRSGRLGQVETGPFARRAGGTVSRVEGPRGARSPQPAIVGVPRPRRDRARHGHPTPELPSGARPTLPGHLPHPRVRRQPSQRAVVLDRPVPPGNRRRRVEFILVSLSGQCKWGHHVYANSETNGPRGDALVYEMIPYIDRALPHRGGPDGPIRHRAQLRRLVLVVVAGQLPRGVRRRLELCARSGGLPRFPADRPLCPAAAERLPRPARGAAPAGSARNDAGGMVRFLRAHGRLPRARRAVAVVRGGLQPSRSRTACPGSSGTAPPGPSIPQTALAWQKYDIRLVLEKNWKTLGPKLQGKLHIVTGELDTFYLEGAVRLLAKTLRDLSSDAQVEIVPGRDHMSMLIPDQIQAARRQMADAFLKHRPIRHDP